MNNGIPCSSCENGFCGNCVADRSERSGIIRNAKDHCSCSRNGHVNKNTKDNRNKNVFSSKKDTEEVHPRKTETNTDDDFEDDD